MGLNRFTAAVNPFQSNKLTRIFVSFKIEVKRNVIFHLKVIYHKLNRLEISKIYATIATQTMRLETAGPVPQPAGVMPEQKQPPSLRDRFKQVKNMATLKWYEMTTPVLRLGLRHFSAMSRLNTKKVLATE